MHSMNSENDPTFSALQTVGYRSSCDRGMSWQLNIFTRPFSLLIRWFARFSQQIWVSDSSRPHSTRQSSSPTAVLTDSNAGCFTLFDPFALFMSCLTMNLKQANMAWGPRSDDPFFASITVLDDPFFASITVESYPCDGRHGSTERLFGYDRKYFRSETVGLYRQEQQGTGREKKKRR